MSKSSSLQSFAKNAGRRIRASVRAITAGAVTRSAQSVVEQLECRTLLSVPNAPSGAGAASSLTGINVTWADNSWDEKGFQVERRTWGGNYSTVATVGAGGTSYWDTAVASNTQYTYRVSALNDSGVSGTAVTNDVATGALLNGVPPVTPVYTPAPAAAATSRLAAPSALATFATSGTTILIAWGSSSGGAELGFKIERRTGNGAYQGISSVPAGVINYTDNAFSGGVTPGTQYTYRVRAYDAQGDSSYSGESTVTTPGANGSPIVVTPPVVVTPVVPVAPLTASGLPTGPIGLSTSPTSSTTVALNWASNSGGSELGFKIERRNGGGGYAAIAVVGAGVTNYTDNAFSGGVTPGTQYTYRVRAYNWQGDSAYSGESSSTTPGGSGAVAPTVTPVVVTPPVYVAPLTASGLPTAPAGLATAATSASTVLLNWANNSGGQELGFKIERRTAGGGYAAIAVVGTGVTTYTDNAYAGGVMAGTQYTYRVRAYNWQGDSGYSNESASTTPGTAVPQQGFQGPPVQPTTTWSPSDTSGYFTIGVFRQPVQTLANWKARGINTAVFFYPDNPDWMTQYIQTTQSLGLYEIRNPQANIYADRGDSLLLAYSHPDEPDINGIPNSFLAAEYAQWKAANPSVPVLVNVSGGDVLRPTYPANKDQIYQGIFSSSDWVTSDVYPVTSWAHPQWIDKAVALVNNGSDPYFSTIAFNNGLAVDKIRQLTGGKHQFSYIETSFQNNSSGPSIGGRVVTPDEFRGESWDAIIHGSKGLIYFPQAFNPDVTDATPANIVAEMTKTDALITSYGAALSSGSDSSNNYVNLPGGLEATWRDFGGHRYYFVLNFSHGGAWNQTLNLPGLSGGAVEVAGEGRSVFSNGAAITDSFQPYQLHVYRV
jgi:hypothetical protein